MKQVLPYSMDKEGCPGMLNVDSHFLVTGSDTGRVKLWDISRRYLLNLMHIISGEGVNGGGAMMIDIKSII